MIRNYSISDGRLFLSEDNTEITIFHAKIGIYRGTVLTSVKFICSRDRVNFESCTCVGNIHSPNTVLPYCITSKKIGNTIEIRTPFVELESVGNEIAIYMLFQHKILTIAAVACLYHTTLVMFLGKSNSGKTTSARLLKIHIPEIQILSDDYVCLRCNGSNIEASVPIWDILSNCDVQAPWKSIEKIILVDLNKGKKLTSFVDLIKYSIGTGFSSDIAFEAFQELYKMNSIFPPVKILHGNYQDFYSIDSEITSNIMNVVPI